MSDRPPGRRVNFNISYYFVTGNSWCTEKGKTVIIIIITIIVIIIIIIIIIII